MLSSDENIKDKIKNRKGLNEEELSLIFSGLVKGLNMEAHDFSCVVYNDIYIPKCYHGEEFYTVIISLDDKFYAIDYINNAITGNIIKICDSKMVDKHRVEIVYYT